MRVVELETQNRRPPEKPADKPVPYTWGCAQISVASVRRWRLFRKEPKYMKIGAAVRYRRDDVAVWLSSCNSD